MPTVSHREGGRRFALAYAALIVYGSLYPFGGWRETGRGWLAFLGEGLGHEWHRGDALINVFAYVPLGLLIARASTHRRPLAASVAIVTLSGGALSFAMEFLQQFLPSRVASLDDLITNSVGTLIGALLASFVRLDARPIAMLARLRDEWFRRGRLADLGLAALALWALSQTTPFVPSIDIGEIRHGLAPLRQVLLHPRQFDVAQCAAYALDVGGLTLAAVTLAAPSVRIGRVFAAFVFAVLLYKIPAVTRQLSMEALAGAVVGLAIALPLQRVQAKAVARIGIVLILAGFTVDELRADPMASLHPFTWIPFSAQLEHPLIGIASILENVWPATALAYLARFATVPRSRTVTALTGGVLLAAISFGLEWHQQAIPGRIGDITTVLLMVAAWVVVWRVKVEDPSIAPGEKAGGTSLGTAAGSTAGAGSRRPPYAQVTRRQLIGWSLGGAAAAGLGMAALSGPVKETRVDEGRLPKLPRPESLPPANLPSFRMLHPRLPHPSQADLETLLTKNPGFLRELGKRANGGHGEIDAVALQALVEPGTVDLDVVFRRLMALEFTWRGHEQGKPLALAYDWLYPLWSEAQRAQLREKLAKGCEYLIKRIRDERLSPYNVILYNAPFQALMACSLALHGDDPGGRPAMNFTADLWKNRVLPVWRQIMGANGGWHEGGEYVGIGIGQAIYELPAMWRSATGEDLIASEPGIRGFLDFLVYRTRPDATHYRWGDGSWFDRIVPDGAPLAIELRHAAAYSLRPPSKEIIPTAWPWGPLNDPTLLDSEASAKLPLTKVFDGIGMIVARSDWTPDATYVTFKAGDNFWSHVHLDQGAFTIYKGGALAIDSGFYGPVYGSDHHMNYTYQTIAHDTVTVTDPGDTVPDPGKKAPRPIANDGGQRRIGSGWGVEAAPLDLDEWTEKRDIYHTGALEKMLDDDGLTVALADVTPAYTNRLSGHGTFSHRTRRVERFWRTFGYDRINDTIVVFDQVIATKAAYRKRWLLHTIEEPKVSSTGFTVRISPNSRQGHSGGSLAATVLLPEGALVTSIGGPGLQFFVDDKNYDENGTLEALIRKLGPTRGEPGAWRIEVSPPRDERDDVFLVVMLPTLGDSAPPHRIRRLEDASRIGCEIAGPRRTTRWWFERGRQSAEVEIVAGAERRRHRLEGPPSPPLVHSWLDRIRAWMP